MKGKKAQLFVLTALALSLILASSLPALAQEGEAGAIAAMGIEPTKIVWQPLVGYGGAVLTIAGPDDEVVRLEFGADRQPALHITGAEGNVLPDGLYNYELMILRPDHAVPPADFDAEKRGIVPWEGATEALVQSGTFLVRDGAFVTPEVEEGAPGEKVAAPLAPDDQVILDDLIVDGSLCVGQDCVNGESFGFDTIRIKENNLRIRAVDTSSTSSFPSNDWQLTFNDTANGGQNKFSIDDIDHGRTPFTLEAGAPSHSLYVDDGGRLGLGTSTPVVDVHVKTGNTPTYRLEQDGTSGFTPQTWDVAGNEAGFFVRDATNGSTLPFRILPGAPSDTLVIAGATDNVGINVVTAPNASAKLHVKQTTADEWAIYGEATETGGRGVFGHASKTSGVTYGVYGTNTSTKGRALIGEATATSGFNYGLYARSYSKQGRGVLGFASASSGTTYGVIGNSKSTSGRGVYGYAKANSGTTRGVYGRVNSPNGWAGYFVTTSGRGVYISAPGGKVGLNVASGTKNAVVRTDDGSRLLYAEESTEVWFSEYGFGQLVDGAAVVPINPVFAQTVNLDEPYHVFLQVYGGAEVYVGERTPEWFEVRLWEGDANVSFSYRLVAKRLGYEQQYLERAPWADDDPNLYPEKRAAWEAKESMAEDVLPEEAEPTITAP